MLSSEGLQNCVKYFAVGSSVATFLEGNSGVARLPTPGYGSTASPASPFAGQPKREALRVFVYSDQKNISRIVTLKQVSKEREYQTTLLNLPSRCMNLTLQQKVTAKPPVNCGGVSSRHRRRPVISERGLTQSFSTVDSVYFRQDGRVHPSRYAQAAYAKTAALDRLHPRSAFGT